MPVAARPQGGHDVVLLQVLTHQHVDGCRLDLTDGFDQLADAVAVDRDAEPDLGLDLVALGDGDSPHVVPEPDDAQPPGLVQAAGSPRPRADTVADGRLAPVADDGLPREPQARLGESELPVTVRRLVQVHEVHVDLGPRELAVELRVQVEQRLLESAETPDPHLRGRERVHPRDHAHACLGCVGLQAHSADLFGRRHDLPADDAHRNRRSGVERRSDLPGVRVDPAEHLVAVEVLTAGDEPGLELTERLRHGHG